MRTNTGDTYDPFNYQKGNKTNTGSSSSSSSSGSSSGGYSGGGTYTNSSSGSSGAYYGGETGLNTNSGRGARRDEAAQTARLLITLDKGVSAYKNHESRPEHTFGGTDSVSIDFKIKDDYLKVSKGTNITAYNQNNFAIQLLFVEPGKNGRANIHTYISISVGGERKGIWFPEAAQLRVIKE
ncbi:hypothetical protein [Rickettsiella endosymbiont of Rhagonycha lignosa]|uniref:hypothetical protein n=1 Tax=Rickettsiella endosymbiont of Rhagonycha lignosa TaxID=3077937 RepID=UPI00313B633C